MQRPAQGRCQTAKSIVMTRKLLTLPVSLLLVFVICLGFQNCMKDKCSMTYKIWTPVYKTKDEVRANIKSNAAKEIHRPGKIYIRGNYIFLNEVDKGIHIIDNSNKQAPRNIAFVDIPGNLDMAVKGNVLYADLYTDLVTIDISNPQSVVVKKINENVFPERYWGGGFINDTTKVIVDWTGRDTTIETYCGGNPGIFGGTMEDAVLMSGSPGSGAYAASSPFGMGGSMARFTVVNNHLYAVSSTSLKVISIANATDPVYTNTVNIGWGIETVYPFADRLFIGSTTGMFIFNISNPSIPVQMGQFAHARTCDPVVADNQYAYVTLRSGTTCEGFENQLDVVDISNISAPSLLKTYPLTNPHGLSKDGNQLIICDGKDGIKFFDASSPNNITLKKKISGIESYDVIAFGGWALVVASEGLYQYSYDASFNVTELSRINVKK